MAVTTWLVNFAARFPNLLVPHDPSIPIARDRHLLRQTFKVSDVNKLKDGSGVKQIADTKLSTWVESGVPGVAKQNVKKPICNATLLNLSFMVLVS